MDLRTKTLVTLLAIAGKFFGAAGGARLGGLPGSEAMQLGAGMVARGEVTLIIVAVGKETGLIGSGAFSAVVVAVLASTMVTPALLRLAFRKPKRYTPVEVKEEESTS